MKSLDKAFIALTNKIERMERMAEKTVAKNYKRTLDDLRISLARMYEKYEIDGQLTLEELNKYNRLDKLDKDVADMIKGLYSNNTRVTRGTLRGIVNKTYKDSIETVRDELGADVPKLKGIMKPVDVTKTINEDMAGLRWTERMGKHRNDAIYDIQKEVKEGLRQGDTYATMSRRLKEKLGTDISKTNTIIRTEGHRCLAQAKQESFNEIAKGGVKVKKKWVSMGDEAVRSAHSKLDGTIKDIDEDFVSPLGGKGYGPGQMNNAKDDINCRCLLVIVLE